MLLSAIPGVILEARLALGVGPDLWAMPITPSAFYRVLRPQSLQVTEPMRAQNNAILFAACFLNAPL